jgi:hypothetical protein
MYIATQNTATVATKDAIKGNLGGTLALAIAMQETSNLLCTYNFGDGKLGDSANFGIYKMNWFMLRQLTTTPAGAHDDVGRTINSDPGLATRILLEAMRKWSINPPEPNHPVANNFWAGHRQGETGLSFPAAANWDDIQDYFLAIQVIKAKCDGNDSVWDTTIRYGLDVDAI